MTATLVICVLSTLTFCLCTRGVMALAASPGEARRLGSRVDRKFSSQAKRIARAYLLFAMILLAGLALAGAAYSYIDLFSAL